MQIPISTIKGTISLILINFLMFVAFSFSGSTATDITILQCLKNTHPECLTPAPLNSVARCATSESKESLELCTFDLKPQCQNNPVVLKACYPREYVRANSLSFIPALFTNGKQMYAIITSMFMHADFDHIWGNMIFLFLVGIFIERRLGTVRFLGFYLLVGIGATLFYYIFNQTSQIALLGASGAISGLMGANLILDFFKSSNGNSPYFKVQTLIFFIFYQFLFTILDPGSNIAYVAHIGGFIAGAILIFYFKKNDEVYTTTPTY